MVLRVWVWNGAQSNHVNVCGIWPGKSQIRSRGTTRYDVQVKPPLLTSDLPINQEMTRSKEVALSGGIKRWHSAVAFSGGDELVDPPCRLFGELVEQSKIGVIGYTKGRIMSQSSVRIVGKQRYGKICHVTYNSRYKK